MSKRLNMNDFSLSHLQNGHNNIHLIGILGELDIIMDTIKTTVF